MRTLPIVLSMALCWVPQAAMACRCADQPLADYYAAADDVAIGIVTASQAGSADNSELAVTLVDAPYKGQGHSGTRRTYMTANSSASCGVSAESGDVLILFGFRTPTELLRVDTCSGTRTLRTATAPVDSGFVDVPARFVVQQLTALAGMDTLAQAAAAPVITTDPDNAALIGLLDLKALAHGGNVPVYADPGTDDELLKRADSISDFYHREAGYEFAAAEVYAAASGSYKLRLKDGRYGWARGESAGTFFSYAELPLRRLAYLTGAWNGLVWPDPGAGLPARVSTAVAPERPAEIPARVLRSTRIGGSLWFYVEVLAGSPCDMGTTRVDRTGWIPAYGTDQGPSVWFYSRGC